MAQPVIIDTDPGIDDAMAILLALCSREIDVRALTSGFGNATAAQTATNACQILDLAGRTDVPVASGASRPLVRRYVAGASKVHGDNGLGNVALPPTTKRPVDTPAAWFLVQQVLAAPGEITIVTLGRLTNLALALHLEPRISRLVRGVVMMGGAALCAGNVSPVAEANIWGDPEAARIVFEEPWPLTMVGLDVTMQTVMDSAYLSHLFACGNRLTDFVSRITPWYRDFYRQNDGIDGFPVHDSSAISYVIRPQLFRTQRYYVKIETAGECSGCTIVDRAGRWQHEPNVNVCVGVDAPALLAMYFERLSRAETS